MKVRSPKLRTIPRAKRRNPLRLDPTRTLAIRQRAIAMVRRQFAELERDIHALVVKENAFNLTANARFTFETSTEKLKAFERWLRKTFGATVTGFRREQLWMEFIRQAHAKGMGRAFDDTRGRKRFRWKPGEGAFYQGSKQEFLKSSFGHPETVDKIKLLAARTFADVKNLSTHVRTKLGRVLVDGLAQGQNPRKVAATMAQELRIGRSRAETIARTELIRAHAEGQLDSMESLGVEEVGAQVEWLVTDDDRLCPRCAEMEDKVFPIAEAHGLIPFHPNCRCAWAPHFAEDDEKPSERLPKGARRGLAKARRFADRVNERTGNAASIASLIDRGINPLPRLGSDLEREKLRTRPATTAEPELRIVSVRSLLTQQSWIDRERLRGTDGPPLAVDKWKGKLVITDGNHRAVSALLAGKVWLYAMVTDLD